MPIYEFECLKCGTLFEELVCSDEEKVKCTSCESGRLKRRFSVFGFADRSGSVSSSSGSSCSSCSTRNCSTCR